MNENVESYSKKELGILTVDLINQNFDLFDCYSSLNFSKFFNNVGGELSCEELESGHGDLSKSDSIAQLRLYLNKMLTVLEDM